MLSIRNSKHEGIRYHAVINSPNQPKLETNGRPRYWVHVGKKTVFAEHDKVKQFETILAIVQEKAAKGRPGD